MRRFNANETFLALTGAPGNYWAEPFVSKSMLFHNGNITGTLETILYNSGITYTRIRVDVRGKAPHTDRHTYFDNLLKACEFAERKYIRC